jgi:hypothetical protein
MCDTTSKALRLIVDIRWIAPRKDRKKGKFNDPSIYPPIHSSTLANVVQAEYTKQYYLICGCGVGLSITALAPSTE